MKACFHSIRSIGLFAFCLVVHAAAQAAAADKPNIVILFTDDMGYADLGSYGNPYIRTPNLDRLAGEGQRWTDFYVAAPVCSPSRGSLLTGKLPVNSGLYGRRLQVMFPDDDNGIPVQELTVAEALNSAGYRTGMFGKWHLGDKPEHYPTRHGFDYWIGIPYSNDMDRVGAFSIERVFELRAAGRGDEASANFAEGNRLFGDPKNEYWNVPLLSSRRTESGFDDTLVQRPVDQPNLTRLLTEETIRFIRDNAEQPFFAYVPYSMPHLPIFRSEEFAGRSLRGRYGDAVEEIDWSVGRIRETLEELGIAENTLVFFSSDNGPWQLASITDAGSAGMLRGSKNMSYEGGMRVPAIFWWPETIEPGIVSGIGSTLDVYATVLSLAGIQAAEGIDGMDLTPVLKGASESPRTEMAYYVSGDLHAYRKGSYKLHLITQEGQGAPKVHHATPLLYDIRRDVSEQQDIAGQHPEIVQDLLEAIERHRAQVTVQEPIFDRRLADIPAGNN